jgi:hypothetical protein
MKGPAEKFREMGLVCETAAERDLAQGIVRGQREVLREFQT